MTTAEDRQTSRKEEKIRGIVFTVGTTPDPILFTIRKLRPEFAVLVASQDTNRFACEIMKKIEEEGIKVEFYTLLVDDPGLLVGCVRTCQEAIAWLLKEKKLPRESVRVDYTGGTKNMSAAAALAATPENLRFIYVTGRRDADGGRVRSGTEELALNDNPWMALGVEIIRRALETADAGQYPAAARMLEELAGGLEHPHGERVRMLKELIEGLERWDSFDHEAAWSRWKEGRLPDRLATAARHAGDAAIEHAAERAKASMNSLKKALDARKCGLKSGGGPDPLVADLLAGALRRIGRGQYDFAALLCYRALELNASRRIERILQLDGRQESGNDFALEKLPENLRDGYAGRTVGSGGRLRLGLVEKYELLEKLGDRSGQDFMRKIGEMKKTLSLRNSSWLAHGMANVSEETAEKMLAEVAGFTGLNISDLPSLPELLS
ncbi:MAG: TIGR02710 family CRISPR-associated CARF protein [Planctomycetota bacterium]|nr:TIGR02710 family CRISPR-associated CARF protein [Planctomycetota bacterium]